MAKNGRLYESDFEEALIELFKTKVGITPMVITSAESLPTH